jgi:hypothetical protein
MAANTNQFQFRKGLLGKSSKNPYQDPTYLSFTILFDTTSPLFNKDIAVKTLREHYKEPERAKKLEDFIDTLLLINREMPWYWVSLDGMSRVFDFNMLEPYWGGTEAKLTITCNESINLAISGLMDLYRESAYDFAAWTQVLPKNLRGFRMWVLVSEVRDINSEVNRRIVGTKQINQNITGDFKPLFQFEFNYCQFSITSAKETFEALNNSAPESPTPKIEITYETIKKTASSYLQGIMAESTGDLGSGGNSDSRNKIQAFGDRLSQDLGQVANNTLDNLTDAIRENNPIKKVYNPNNIYGSELERAYQQTINELDSYAGGLGGIVDNAFGLAEGVAKDAATSFKQSIVTNIFGADGATVGAALRQGSIASIFPMINNISEAANTKSNLGNNYE